MRSVITLFCVALMMLPAAVSVQRAHAQAPRADVLIAYYTMTGTTQSLAQIVARGADEIDGVNVTLKPIEAVSMDDLRDAEGIILGSPTYYANMAGPMKSFIDSIGLEHDSVFLGGKVGGGVNVTEKLNLYGEFSFLTGDVANAYGTKVGAKYHF